jgi:hypothetical protein
MFTFSASHLSLNRVKLLLAFLVFLSLNNLAWAQGKNWDTYLAQYEKGPGSTTLNMALLKAAAQKNLPFLVITGVTTQDCGKEGFPTKEAFDQLYKLSDHIEEVISETTVNELAGSFTYQCERLDYFYVHDTLQLRKKLTALYTSKYSHYTPTITIKKDRDWEAYTKFLYPNEQTREYMANEKVLNGLRLAGDALEKPRTIEHWLYFNSSKEREQFITYAVREKFKIESIAFVKKEKQPYQVQISRTDNIELPSLNKLTLELKQKAKELNGNYDGWESPVLRN